MKTFPPYYLITPEPTDPTRFFQSLSHVLASGIRLIQFRAKSLSDEIYQDYARQVLDLCQEAGVICLLNCAPTVARQLGSQGIHLNSSRLHEQQKPLQGFTQVSAACHTIADLQQAARIQTDFVVLGPVLVTASHPDTLPMGWATFTQLIQQTHCPVYALGGLQKTDLTTAQQAGAVGIAAIRSLWQL
ncbi:thiamine phosphate synthase [Beggiatoa leptomitoformis]|uniref:thiamine phosphate synthase n=1 Tax=Beggiatoa leptomitoformis TaxID=288004 RepID=UPI00070596E4|nr:thiamine phosphate synthase [Beggiatoa leptomitoformis]